MKPLAPVLVLVLAGCAVTAPPAPGGAADRSGKAGSMMEQMCQRQAAEPGRAASAPAGMQGMMDKHCQQRAEAPAGAASHVH